MHDSSWSKVIDIIRLILSLQILAIAEGTKTGVKADPSTRGPTIGDVIPGLNVEPGSYLMPLWGVILLVVAPSCLGLSWGIIEITRLYKLPIDGSGVNYSSESAMDSGASTDGDSPLLGKSNAVDKSLKMMREVSAHIADGATAFLIEEYKYLFVYVIVFGIVIGVITSWFAALSFLVGAITSCLAGFIGMRTAVFCNVRTAHECWKSLRKGYEVAIRGGSVMGFTLVSLGVLTVFALIALLNTVMKFENSGNSYDGPSILFEALAGYGLGGSSIALFARVGGGIYTKAADVGADLSGKNEYGMDEDDPRNPACIADNVGDNVGDIAGMGADLFGSFAEATCAAFVLIGNSTLSHLDIYEAPIMYPLLISSLGIFVSWITVLMVPLITPVKDIECIERSLKALLFVSTLLMTPAIVGLSYVCLPQEFMVGMTILVRYACMVSVIMGLWSGLLVGLVTEYFTSHSYGPVRDIARSQRTSAATGIIYGLALGYLSTIVPVLALSVTILVSHEFCGMYGIALAALGMLSTLCVGLAIDAYGPIADNAGGIAEMSNLGPSIRRRTDALDAAGNTTAAVGKGFAIGGAALVALALFGAFCTRANIDKVNVLNAWTFAGILYGAMMPYAFSALTMKSVGKAATDMVDECMRQFPKIINGEAPPDYTRCISISTSASLKEMILPGALVILSPLVFGILCGKNATAGLLVGALSSGVQMAISMSNTGGAWDNAKKFIESGGLGPEHGKGSAAHKHAVTGDTVGDPLKDTSGPSLNILVKLSAIISLVFGSIIDIRFSNSSGGPIWLRPSS
ncbi:H+-translocating inorganic pyrophosphatase TVP1, putative [Perkinsus marinus ATCC 50983]|uniref:H(+)-exporting diphosphatase n=1 Tax=Perkinsus marinus (strain ATCC 50983 / TXsc) TaxID=423536 RepID=C5LNW7_PERM5|nr:H+-translocating inorganic pyrophosphatase TVP1, putative [Perkinsus marinus ATCC 50983]EER01549.1 H+-translocating inorganic pyrophosphatase TVP1, putative [Perkinsus marinus ATCC 50983]|eukprot:XP_002768831.1 H+-translocating inorganic pyrophosphatase TVP1, putative [Perkinsus marinus ATCC 50983]